ncbi:MAG TPA: metallopeptidase family protein [Syntrophales bacterium]|nr:metallopeptidase family protein [Syntrophales bacterium]
MKKRLRLSEIEFDRVVTRAIKRIPQEIHCHLQNILISVQKRPSKDIREEMGLHRNAPLLGMYRGTSLMDRSVTYPPIYPDTIILFQEPLEKMCETVKELEEQIEITVVHEIAHFLGISEERLAELGYG